MQLQKLRLTSGRVLKVGEQASVNEWREGTSQLVRRVTGEVKELHLVSAHRSYAWIKDQETGELVQVELD